MYINRFLYALLLIVVISSSVFSQSPVKTSHPEDYLGTWQGSVARTYAVGDKKELINVIWRIHKIDNSNDKIYLTEVYNYDKPDKKKISRYMSIPGTAYHKYLRLYLSNGSTNGKCDFNISLGISVDRFSIDMRGIAETSTECDSYSMSFEKLNSDTASYIDNAASIAPQKDLIEKSGLLPPLATGIYAYNDTNKVLNIIQRYTLVIQNVTKAGATFRYKAMQNMCNIEFGGELKLDPMKNFAYLSPDGKTAFVLITERGAVVLHVDKCEKDECAPCPTYGHYRFVTPDITKYNPDTNPLAGLVLKPTNGVKPIQEGGTNSVKGGNTVSQVKSIKRKAPSGGGTTPDELGRILLRALQTNNKQLWMNCVHPEQSLAFNDERFDEFRKWIEQDGVSDWSKVSFSRVTFTRESMGSDDKGLVKGDQVRRNFKVEFTYKGREFIGGFGIMTISTYNGGNKFLIWFPGKDTVLQRRDKAN